MSAPVDVRAVMDAEIATLRRLESWVNEALAPTNADAQGAILAMTEARAAVARLADKADTAERLIRNLVNAGTIPAGYLLHADDLRDALTGAGVSP